MDLPEKAFLSKRAGVFKKQAFTLIELILVVLLLAIIAGLTIPNFVKTYSHFQLAKTADDLSYLMRYAQSRAISKNRVVQLVFSTEFSQYWLEQGDDKGVGFERFRSRLGRTFPVPHEIDIKVENQTLKFYSDGSIEKERINVCQEQKCVIVSTQEQRGYIRVFKSDENQ